MIKPVICFCLKFDNKDYMDNRGLNKKLNMKEIVRKFMENHVNNM